MHFGFNHGLVNSLDAPAEDLPFSRRFFPGGESSVRGYRQGAAAPRNEFGDIIGAQSYVVGNMEFEQGLTETFSIVAFFDGVGFSQTMDEYPAEAFLFSAGLGLRWKTIIGPVRIEYGHNLNPRPRDSAGTFHFSVGFPF
jgi:outer membrane translocation and assembly module TamA